MTRLHYLNRFRQLKEEEKKKVSKALPAEQVQMASTSDPEDESDEETNPKVNSNLWFLIGTQ